MMITILIVISLENDTIKVIIVNTNTNFGQQYIVNSEKSNKMCSPTTKCKKIFA